MKVVKVELICKDEDVLVAEVVINSGVVLDARALRRGLTKVDSKRLPAKTINSIQDGQGFFCTCGGLFHFRTTDGEPFVAMPGLGRVQA